MEQLEMSKADVDKKVERILKLIKRRNRGKKDQELVGLVEDFHKQYQLLYAQYDHLIRQPGKQAREGNGNGNGSCSYHASSSDSEYYSSEDVEINTALSNNRSSFRRTVTNMGEELKKAYAEVADLKHQLASRKKEKEALDSDHRAALSKIQETETMNADLRNEMDGLEERLFALGTVPKGQVAEQLAGLITELESHHKKKSGLEAELCGKLAELEQQRETNKALLVHISEEGVAERMEQIKDNENNLTSKIEDSMARVSNLKNEVDYLRSQKCESFDEVNIMKQELESVRSRNTELEMVLERKSTEVSQYLIQVKTLKEELARKSDVEQIMAEEKEALQVQVMDLESEVDALRKQKNKPEDEVKSKLGEINHLREEKGQLNARILELKTLYRERSLEEDRKCKRANETAKMKAEVNLLQPKLDSLKAEQSSLECQITNQQTTTKEKDNNKSMPLKTRLVRRLSLGNITNLNYHNLERKMEDLAVEFGKKIDDGIRLLYQRIKIAERIQHENTQIFKLTRERLQQEIETLYLDNEALQQRVGTIDYELRTLKDTMEAEKAAMAGLNAMMDKLEDERNYLTPNVTDEGVSVIDECEQAKSNVEILVAEMQKENEEELLREKVMSLEAKLSEEGEEKLTMLKEMRELEQKMREMHEENELLRERVMNLKAKLSEEGEEMLKALKAMSELEKLSKEKDEILSDREEEKREAIRQLCLLIDYHRTCSDHLKKSISTVTLTLRNKKMK
ncbi:COP1-interactive protein 1-like isoform X1 [Gossypium arboreum]|nr:COP1-interactive protein 1-like isoform X1 [Gossypium arboreum]